MLRIRHMPSPIMVSPMQAANIEGVRITHDRFAGDHMSTHGVRSPRSAVTLINFCARVFPSVPLVPTGTGVRDRKDII